TLGTGLATSLLEAGHELTVFNRTASRMQALVGHGARTAATVADTCRGDAVVTMLADDGHGRGHGARRHKRHRWAPPPRDPALPARRAAVRACWIRGTAGTQGHPTYARRRGNAARPDAAREPAARPVSDAARPGWRGPRLVGHRPAGRAGCRTVTRRGPHGNRGERQTADGATMRAACGG